MRFDIDSRLETELKNVRGDASLWMVPALGGEAVKVGAELVKSPRNILMASGWSSAAPAGQTRAASVGPSPGTSWRWTAFCRHQSRRGSCYRLDARPALDADASIVGS